MLREGQVILDLERTLRSLGEKRKDELLRLEERIDDLARKERQVEQRLKQIRAELERARQDGPRIERQFHRKQVLALTETLAGVAADLSNADRGAWGDRLPIPAVLRETPGGGTEIVLLLPAAPDVVANWEAHAEAPPLRIALVAFAMLAKIAVEYALPGVPEPGAWGPFLMLRLDLGTLDEAARAEMMAVDAALCLEEATPKPWAGGGRERVPALVWIPAKLLEESQA